MMGTCSKCDKLYDADGFWEHESKKDGTPLYKCSCGNVFDKSGKTVKANLIGLENYSDGFIRGSRLIESGKNPRIGKDKKKKAKK